MSPDIFPLVNQRSSLTIAIPTYNRVSHLDTLLDQLIKNNVLEVADILVIDDGSSDKTFEAITKKYCHICNIKVLKNEINLGYSWTFVRVFKECETEYVLIMADDDLLVTESLTPLIKFLKEEKPAFCSPQFLSEGLIYRGKNKNRIIMPKEFFQCSAHAPGLVYNITKCNESLNLLAGRIRKEKADVLIYPQVVLVIILLLANAKCYWLQFPLASEGANAPSGIRDANGSEYWSFESRWRQIKAFDALLSDFRNSSFAGDILNEIYNAHRLKIFGWLVIAMESESPELRLAFDHQAWQFYLKRFFKKLLPITRIQNLYRVLRSYERQDLN